MVELNLQGVRAQGDDALDVGLCTIDELPEDKLTRGLICRLGHVPILPEAVCRIPVVERHLQGVRAQGDDALDVSLCTNDELRKTISQDGSSADLGMSQSTLKPSAVFLWWNFTFKGYGRKAATRSTSASAPLTSFRKAISQNG